MIAQEYGESPTALWISTDGLVWKRLLSNIDVDHMSRHFHYVIYDEYQRCMYVTLGDGNVVRAITVDVNGKWKPIYRGPWQFAPMVIARDRVIFGFDSGITRGGVGIFDPKKGKWKFIFLKWVGKGKVKHCQMCDLKYLKESNIYILLL